MNITKLARCWSPCVHGDNILFIINEMQLGHDIRSLKCLQLPWYIMIWVRICIHWYQAILGASGLCNVGALQMILSVPTKHSKPYIMRNIRSTTNATYFQSSFVYKIEKKHWNHYGRHTMSCLNVLRLNSMQYWHLYVSILCEHRWHYLNQIKDLRCLFCTEHIWLRDSTNCIKL